MENDSPTFELGDLADRSLGEFKLLRRLGRGGMAEVYLAEQTSLSRFVAVKVLLPEMLSDADGVPLKRFEQEAQAAGSINHPNIVQVYTIGEQDGLHFIVQEFVEGMNLSEFVKRNGPPDGAAGLQIMEQVSAALKVAGDAGIVHRDIKPENIMLTSDGTAKVADFGLAQLSQKEEKLNLTQQGTTMGTPLYMSPEQINGHPLDQRSDLYSFGVTCYHMLAGRAPFRGETAMAVAVQHLKESAPPLRERRPDLPKAVCGIVDKMMNKDPKDRFQDAASLLAAIEKAKAAVAEGQDEMSLSALGIPSLAPVAPAPGAVRRQWLAFLFTCLSVGLVSAVIGHFTKPTDPLTVPARSGSAPAGSKERQFAIAIADPENKSAWRAVIEHFGDEPLEGGWARIHLGLIYLSERRFGDAARLFSDVVKYNSEPLLKLQGHIGLAALALEQDDVDAAQEIIERFEDQREDLRGTVMDGWYRRIRDASRSNAED